MTAPPGWDQYESASQALYRDRTPVTSTANPRQFALRPCRSLAPGTSAHPGLSSVPKHDPERSHELAYTGPSYGPRDTREVQRLLGMINKMVGEEPTSSPPAYLKVTKMTLLKPYNGKDDLDTFEIWFHNLLEFFRTLQITGPSMDRDQLRILGDCLSEDTTTWMIGHFASDPSCPNFGKKTNVGQRMFAQRVIDDTSDEEHPKAPAESSQVESDPVTTTDPVEDEHRLVEQTKVVQDLPQSEYNFIGSQYESKDERVQSDWDEYEYDHTTYAASMRIEALASGGLANKPRIHSMAVANERGMRHVWIYNAKVRKIEDPAAQSRWVHKSQRALCAEIPINGIKVLVLFDSGCTTDSIMPEFTYLCKAGRIDLQEPVGLQLGTKGSRTKINFGAQAEIAMGSVRNAHYFDVVDIDKYDAILGTVFCHKYGIVLDFANTRVLVRTQSVPLFKEEAASSKITK
ncbi:hypothetical protein TRAPUB_11689 [Trametes pubescens]|uniref:Uncharacterized protein n=1 Tax=Trametes pubescens TaxID=154538 RepID=A0A1M2VVZ6_TRAPU|nr:hypothetical protein TRAPUB_11689 [Trametes pubescens]